MILGERHYIRDYVPRLSSRSTGGAAVDARRGRQAPPPPHPSLSSFARSRGKMCIARAYSESSRVKFSISRSCTRISLRSRRNARRHFGRGASRRRRGRARRSPRTTAIPVSRLDDDRPPLRQQVGKCVLLSEPPFGFSDAFSALKAALPGVTARDSSPPRIAVTSSRVYSRLIPAARSG